MPPVTRHGGRRVLVVEDDASLRRLLELRLGAAGHTVRLAGDGCAALEVLQSWRPEVIVSDVMMPRMSGLSLCRAVRSDHGLRDLPVILLTARHFDADVQQVLDLGGITFMNKPFDATALLEALDHSAAGVAVANRDT
ncbi:MAG: response regulator [Candidatus Dormibacteria bacterium]